MKILLKMARETRMGADGIIEPMRLSTRTHMPTSFLFEMTARTVSKWPDYLAAGSATKLLYVAISDGEQRCSAMAKSAPINLKVKLSRATQGLL